jgi:hypothetical protein
MVLEIDPCQCRMSLSNIPAQAVLQIPSG